MYHPVLPERTVDLVVQGNAKTCFYHGIGCVNVHSGKLGVGRNAAAGENALYLKIFDLCKKGDYEAARPIQHAADAIIYAMCSCKGNMYAVIKEILRRREGIDIGSVRKPLFALVPEDMEQVEKCVKMIDEAIEKYCG